MDRFSVIVAKIAPKAEYETGYEIGSGAVQKEVKGAKKKKQKIEGKPLKLGGAIRDDVRKLDLYTPSLDYKKILRDAAYVSGPPRPKTYLHGVIDMIPRNQIGFYQYPVIHTSEEELHYALLKSVSGRGARYDHPTVQRSVYESLKHNPDLAHAYMHA